MIFKNNSHKTFNYHPTESIFLSNIATESRRGKMTDLEIL